MQFDRNNIGDTKLIRIHIITKNKPGATIHFKTKIVIILLVSTKNVDTDK